MTNLLDYLTRDESVPGGILERRADLVIEGKNLLCGVTPQGGISGDPIALPAVYLQNVIDDAQAALRAITGARRALVTITVRVQPYCLPLNT